LVQAAKWFLTAWAAMSKGFDYSKWDKIDLSDDEEDFHPNIDKDSWVRLKHRTRVENEEDESKKVAKWEKRLEELKNDLKTYGEAGKGHAKAVKMQTEVDKIEADLAKVIKDRKWNADNMSKTTENRCMVSDAGAEVGPEPKLPSEEIADGYCEFVEANEELLEEYISMGSDDYTLENVYDFLKVHGGTLLQGEHAESYLLLDCLEKEMNGDHKEMVLSARQHQLLTQIREFSRGVRRPARDGVVPIFTRLLDHEETRKSFQDAVDQFIKRVEKRAPEKMKEMDAAREAEEAEEAQDGDDAGPGGLTPTDVMKTLPGEMQEAFRTKDIARLQRCIESLPEEDAKYHMRRCEASGLWAPQGDAPYQH